MPTHGLGKGMLPISTSISEETHSELQLRAAAGHWKSTCAYIRAVLEYHVQREGAIREQRTLYVEKPPEKSEEKGRK